MLFSPSVYSDMFGEDCVDFKDKSNLSVTVDGKTAYINLETRVSVMLERMCKFSSYTKVLGDLTHS